MEFIPIRSLSRELPAVLSRLQRDGKLVVTKNGQPTILMVNLVGNDFMETIQAVSQKHPNQEKISAAHSRQQLEAFDTFVSTIRAIENEPLDDEDFAFLESNRISFNREINL